MALIVELCLAAAEDPAIASVGTAQAEFALVEGALATEVGLEPRHGLRLVLRMQQIIPGVEARDEIAVAVAQHAQPAIGHEQFTRHDVPVPDAIVGAGHRQLPTLFAFGQRLFSGLSARDLLAQFAVAELGEAALPLGGCDVFRQLCRPAAHAVEPESAGHHQQQKAGPTDGQRTRLQVAIGQVARDEGDQQQRCSGHPCLDHHGVVQRRWGLAVGQLVGRVDGQVVGGPDQGVELRALQQQVLAASVWQAAFRGQQQFMVAADRAGADLQQIAVQRFE
jgi:hypothetical protein